MAEEIPADSMWVIKKNNGNKVLIHKSWYNPQYHDLPKAETLKQEPTTRKKLPEVEEKKSEPPKIEAKPAVISPDQMATMSLKDLQALPAYKEIQNKVFKTKDDVIKALQEVMVK